MVLQVSTKNRPIECKLKKHKVSFLNHPILSSTILVFYIVLTFHRFRLHGLSINNVIRLEKWTDVIHGQTWQYEYQVIILKGGGTDINL